MVSIAALLILLALVFVVLSIMGKAPVWVAVLLVVLERLLDVAGGLVR